MRSRGIGHAEQYIEPMTGAPKVLAETAARWRPAGQCEVCRGWQQGAVCAACTARFAPPRLRCQRCALPTAHAVARCGACLHEPPPFERAVAAVDYAFPWDALVGALKFAGRVDLAAPLAQMLAGAVRRAGGAHAGTLVVPVPLAAARLGGRGFNQAWEIARHVATDLGLDASAAVLERVIDSAPQAGLHRQQRLRNLHAAFAVAAASRPTLTGRRIALVDDVVTTGATASEAARALLRGGAAAVEVWAVARTPEP